MTISEFCLDVENRLGWVPLGDHDEAMSSAARRIEEEQKKHPNIYAMANLRLALNFMRKQRVFIHDPADVLLYVKPALQDAGLRHDWARG